MLALGALLTAAALLVIAVVALIFRRPDPPRWTTRSWVGELITVGIVSLFAVGLGCLAAGALAAYQDGPALLDLGLLAAVLVGFVALWRRLDVRARLKAMDAETAAAARRGVAGPLRPAGGDVATATPVITPEPPPSRPSRRAA